MPLGVIGLPCASQPLVMTERGPAVSPFPAVVVVPLGCQRCGQVLYYAIDVMAVNAASPIIRLR